MIAGSITSKSQHADLFIGKVTKVSCKNYYDIHTLDVPASPTTGHPLTSSRQLCAICLAQSWEQATEALVTMAWKVGNHAKCEDLQQENAESSTVFSEHTQNSIVRVILESSDHEAVENVLYEVNVHSNNDVVDKNLLARFFLFDFAFFNCLNVVYFFCNFIIL